MKNIISRLTMKRISFNFIDTVSGKSVYNYTDKYKNIYLANYPFFIWSFRVKI